MQEFFKRQSARITCVLQSHLPERRIEILSDTGQRTIRIGTREQLMGIASAAMIAGWLTLGTVNIVATDNNADERTQAELARMAAQVQALKADTAVLKGAVATTAERIEARQHFLDNLLTGRLKSSDLADLLPRNNSKLSATAAAAQGVLAPFAALEQKQIALMDRAAATAETRLRDAEALIGRLGLNPSRFVAQSVGNLGGGRHSMGGPFIEAPEGSGTDPRFAELFVSWQRVEQIEGAMASLPAFVPARSYTLTSNFGFRYDPFHGRSASHGGLDLAGAHGEPIYAAADGKVVRAGRFGAYGNAIDIDHGRGIITRYAHLSKVRTKVGERVKMGERIGDMGSTGRSTGTHLHYEVRIDGRAVDPRPFIEASSYLLAFKRETVGPQLTSAD